MPQLRRSTALISVKQDDEIPDSNCHGDDIASHRQRCNDFCHNGTFLPGNRDDTGDRDCANKVSFLAKSDVELGVASFNCATLFVQEEGYFTTLPFCFPA